MLAVYTGPSLANLKQVAANDDDPAGGTTSKVTFVTPVAPGEEYQIAVDALGGVAGKIKLNIDFKELGPPLHSTVSGKNIVLSWPSIAPGFAVEAADDLTTPSWTPVSEAALVIGDVFSAKIAISAGRKFYRLRSQ